MEGSIYHFRLLLSGLPADFSYLAEGSLCFVAIMQIITSDLESGGRFLSLFVTFSTNKTVNQGSKASHSRLLLSAVLILGRIASVSLLCVGLSSK